MRDNTKRILEVLRDHRFDENDGWMYGLQVMVESELPIRKVYPGLRSLEEDGWLETYWEKEPPHGRLARHYYRLKYDRIDEANRELAPSQRRTRTPTINPAPQGA